jgi:hypothetical protein
MRTDVAMPNPCAMRPTRRIVRSRDKPSIGRKSGAHRSRPARTRLRFPSAFENEAGYIKPIVKIELGARSDDWPHEDRPVQPHLVER